MKKQVMRKVGKGLADVGKKELGKISKEFPVKKGKKK